MAIEDISTVSTPEPVVATKTGSGGASNSRPVSEQIDKDTYQGMLDILDDLTDHTHIFFDDYTTACNCNCNCNCTRGIL